jgi:hypothetical protein
VAAAWVSSIRLRKLHRFFAVKFLPESLAKDHQALERFRREAEAADAIQYGCVLVLDCNRTIMRLNVSWLRHP